MINKKPNPHKTNLSNNTIQSNRKPQLFQALVRIFKVIENSKKNIRTFRKLFGYPTRESRAKATCPSTILFHCRLGL